MALHSQAQSRERDGFSRKGKRFFLVPFEGNEGLPSLHGEMCATARTHLLGEKRATARTHLLGEKRATARTHLLGEKRATARPLLLQWSGSVRAATAGTVAPSHPLLTFGRLTTKFEMLYKETKSKQLQNFVGGQAGLGGVRRGGRGRRASRERVRAVQRSCAKIRSPAFIFRLTLKQKTVIINSR